MHEVQSLAAIDPARSLAVRRADSSKLACTGRNCHCPRPNRTGSGSRSPLSTMCATLCSEYSPSRNTLELRANRPKMGDRKLGPGRAGVHSEICIKVAREIYSIGGCTRNVHTVTDIQCRRCVCVCVCDRARSAQFEPVIHFRIAAVAANASSSIQKTSLARRRVRRPPLELWPRLRHLR